MQLQELAVFLESVPDAMIVVDSEGVIAYSNQQAARLFGYDRSELLGQMIEILVPDRYRSVHCGFRENYTKAPVPRPMGLALDLFGLSKFGKEFPVEISLSPIVFAGHRLVASAIRDITERKRVEEQLRKSLQDKEILLKEIHHRVKNNLQTISSLLNLQAQMIDDPNVKEVFDDARARVRTFALLHEKLYRSKDLAKIDAQDYLRDLAQELIQCTGAMTDNIEVDVSVEQISLGIDTIINCGLIVSELVSNAIKYAFPDRATGKIAIGLCACSRNRARLSVHDNGIGLPVGFDPSKDCSLGLQLVNMFAGELGGKLSMNSETGAGFVIEFPIN